MTTIITDPQTVGQAPGCPAWCTGRHPRERYPSHIAACCPAWCAGHLAGNPDEDDQGHCDAGAEVELSLAAPCEDTDSTEPGAMRPDFLLVQRHSGPENAGPYVAVMHGADECWLPRMTPGEAFALGAALIRKAWSLDPDAAAAAAGSGDAGWQGCPPWCASLPHDSGAPDDVHMSEAHTVPCNLTAREEGHICCYTNCSDPQFRQESCDLPNFAQLVLSEDGTYSAIEVGHGDDLLPDMRLDAAERLGLALIGLAAAARETSPASD